MNAMKQQICPHCEEPVKIKFDFKKMAIWFLPAIILGVFLKYLFVALGIPGAIAYGIPAAVVMLLGIGLQKDET